ncbi:hypothetical protein ACM66B_002069 [Microbotryomycetes sp. NB124-2]
MSEQPQSTVTSEAASPSGSRLALPPPPPPSSHASESNDATTSLPDDGQATATTLTVNEQSVSLFDKLGPTVVNSDGTLSRIGNWAELLPHERANVLRVLGKRNQIRLEDKKRQLLEQQQQAQEEDK